MENTDLKQLISLLEERNQLLKEREQDLADRNEELQAQKEELTAAIEALALKNTSLTEAMAALKQRNLELDQILYRASHDLRTPVTSIWGLLDLMKTDGLKKSQVQIHEHMEQKVYQMNHLLRSMSTLAQAAFETVQSQPVDIKRTINDCIHGISDLPNFPLIAFDLKHSVDVFNTDELLYAIVVRCLLANAVTFREKDIPGKVCISIDKVDDKLVTVIADDGEGISNQIEARIFEMFFRGSSKSLGAGLGLYIVKSVMDRLKGEITWYCRDGYTTFLIKLPSN